MLFTKKFKGYSWIEPLLLEARCEQVVAPSRNTFLLGAYVAIGGLKPGKNMNVNLRGTELFHKLEFSHLQMPDIDVYITR